MHARHWISASLLGLLGTQFAAQRALAHQAHVHGQATIQVAIAGWSNFRSMVTGYEIVDAADAEIDPAISKEEEAA